MAPLLTGRGPIACATRHPADVGAAASATKRATGPTGRHLDRPGPTSAPPQGHGFGWHAGLPAREWRAGNPAPASAPPAPK